MRYNLVTMVGTEEQLTLPAREVLKTEFFPHRCMSVELMDKWGEGIPSFSDTDVLHPEWRPTPLLRLDLTSNGYGEVLVKNEADPESNPTGTIKDRAAWELATLYRDYARTLYLKIREGALPKDDLKRSPVPTLSLITAGNEGSAIANRFQIHDLPPPRLIVDKKVSKAVLGQLRQLRASVYLVDLSQRALTTEDILRLTDNQNGVDITSVQFIEPQAIFYDWHVHEVFNEMDSNWPNEIYVPYGSGRLMENYLYWQAKSVRNEAAGTPDARLRTKMVTIAGADVLGGEPEKPDSDADKLTAKFKPFLLFKDPDIRGLRNFSFTGEKTGVEKVQEEYIKHGSDILNGYGITAEPSSDGLALYMQRWDQGQVKPRSKVVVVNTGRGLYEGD